MPKSSIQPSESNSTVQPPVSFELLLPAIRRNVTFAFRRVPCAAKQELIAAAIARAFEMYIRLVQRGKAALAYASALANYAVKQVRDGRSTGSQQKGGDVFASLAQRRHSFSVTSINTSDLTDARKADPAELAALRIDVAAWFSRMTPQKRRLAVYLAVGNSTNEAANRFGISAARVSQIRRELQDAWETFHALPAIT